MLVDMTSGDPHLLYVHVSPLLAVSPFCPTLELLTIVAEEGTLSDRSASQLRNIREMFHFSRELDKQPMMQSAAHRCLSFTFLDILSDSLEDNTVPPQRAPPLLAWIND